jgi:predicted DNA-binding protein (MmcQ/YjbR family)
VFAVHRRGKELDVLLDVLRGLCAELPGSEEYVMVHHPAFRVGKRPFAIAGMNQHESGATLSINLGRDAQAHLLDDERFEKTPYIGQHGWVTVPHDKLAKRELATLVTDSWRRVANKKQLAQLRPSSKPKR